MREPRPIALACFASAAMLLLAVAPWPYGYYRLLRLVVCATAIGAGIGFTSRRPAWPAVVLFGLALLFNPLVPVGFDRSVWAVLDVAGAGIMAWAGFRLRTLPG